MPKRNREAKSLRESNRLTLVRRVLIGMIPERQPLFEWCWRRACSGHIVMPKVSVVIPAFNAAAFVAEACRSIVAQTISDWEIILVNDGSQDNTLGVVQTLAAHDRRFKIVNLASNVGPGPARNAALAVAGGDWIAMLDADDWYCPARLEVLIGVAEQRKADIVLDNQFIVDPGSRGVSFIAFDPADNAPTSLGLGDFLRNVQSNVAFDFGYLKPIIRRDWLVAKNIRYRDELRLGEDLMLLLECYANDAKIMLVSKPYYYYRLQYSLLSGTISGTTRTEVRYEPLLTATEQYLEKNRQALSDLECRLLVALSESLHDTMIVRYLKGSLKERNIFGLINCLCHPIRLFRAAYFTKRRKFLFRRRAKRFMARATCHETATFNA